MPTRRPIVLVLAIGVATAAHAASLRSACLGTRFVAATSLLSGGASPDALVLTSDDQQQQLVRWTCGAGATVVRVRRGVARVRATWAACGTHERVRLAARVDPTCTMMVGKVKARGESRITFTATATPCTPLAESSATAVFLDCAYGRSSFAASTIGTPALHALTIYQSRQGTATTHPTGQMSLQVDDPGPSVLFLHSYEPTDFVVQTGSGAVVSYAIAEGAYTPGLNVPVGVPGEIHGDYDIDVDCSDWSSTDGQPCINDIEPQRLLEHTGLCVQSIDGCYQATQAQLP